MPTQNSTGFIATTIVNKVATIEFGHPASNSFPRKLLDRFTLEIKSLSMNPDVCIIIIRAQGTSVFCSGASFDELLEISNFEDGKKFFAGFANLINAMRSCTKIIVGRVQGKAVGGGLGIAAACDYVFATNLASIKLSELSIGIGPFVIEPAVSRKIGKTAMTQITLSAHEWKTASWAAANGLYSSVFENTADLDHELQIFCDKLASYNPEALTEMRKIFWEGTAHWEQLLSERAEISGKLILSDFSKTALNQFKNQTK